MFVSHEFDKARITNHNFIHCNVPVPVSLKINWDIHVTMHEFVL